MPQDLSSWQDWSRGLEPLDLKNQHPDELDKRDIIGKIISGTATGLHFRRNFQRCAFREATLSDLHWERVDYKDTVFIKTEISDSMLGEGSTVSCTYTDCTFIRCNFSDAAFHDCIYERCEFIECEFQDSMVRNSELIECRFVRSITSNKLFDGCRLLGNEFVETALDFRAILDNFGLDSRQLPLDSVREDRTHPHPSAFPFDERLVDQAWVSVLSPFDAMKLQFYLNAGELSGGELIDRVFHTDAWTTLVRAPVNLMRLLQDFAEFIFYLYRNDRLDVIFILKLAILSESIWQGFQQQPVYAQVSQAGSGIYFRSLQSLIDLEAVVENWLNTNGTSTVTYQTADDADDKSVADLAGAIKNSFPDIAFEIRPRNSPVDFVFSNLPVEIAIALITLFFSTKTRIELTRLKTNLGKAAVQSTLFALAVGGAKSEDLHNALSLKASLPGSIIFRLNVDYSSALVDKLKRVVKLVIQ
jgi:hypothetical protein